MDVRTLLLHRVTEKMYIIYNTNIILLKYPRLYIDRYCTIHISLESIKSTSRRLTTMFNTSSVTKIQSYIAVKQIYSIQTSHLRQTSLAQTAVHGRVFQQSIDCLEPLLLFQPLKRQEHSTV